MLAWAVVWKEKRRKETKQKHWPTKKRKQERKRTKHPVQSSQSVEEGGSVSSAFLCWSGHRQPSSSPCCSNLSFPFFSLSAHQSCHDSCLSPSWISRTKGGFRPSLLSRCHFVRNVASAGRTIPGSSPGMIRSLLGTDRRKLTLSCSKMRGKHRAWGCVVQPAPYCGWANKIYHLNWSQLWAWAEKLRSLCTSLRENASRASSQQLTREWNQCGDLVVVSAQEGASLQGGVAGMGQTGRLKPMLFIPWWGGSTMNRFC